MYPTVGALPIAAVKTVIGSTARVEAEASPRPPRPPPPRPPRAAPRPPRAASPRSPCAASPWSLAIPPAGAVAGAGGFIAATSGLRSSSVDHRRIFILIALPGSLTFADFAVRFTAPVPVVCLGAGVGARWASVAVGQNATDRPKMIKAEPRPRVVGILKFIDSPRGLRFRKTRSFILVR